MEKFTDAIADALAESAPRTDVRYDAPPRRGDGDAARKRPPALAWMVHSDRHRFAAKVRAGRAVLGWSQTELARRTGLSQRSIYRLELAAVDVRRSTVVALEAVFADAGITFEQLADGGFRIVVAGAQTLRQ